VEPSTDNPYPSPPGRFAPVVSEQFGWGSASASFTFGDTVVHTVTLVMSLNTGLEVYLVDGQEVLRRRSFALWGSRRFSIEGPEPHQVEIRVKCFPLSSQARVDGELIINDLFPRFRNAAIVAVVVGGAGAIAVGWALGLAARFFFG
jgi:hypothetical protein